MSNADTANKQAANTLALHVK